MNEEMETLPKEFPDMMVIDGKRYVRADSDVAFNLWVVRNRLEDCLKSCDEMLREIRGK